MPQKRKDTYRTGLMAEGMASLYLWSKGYRILKQRYKAAGAGEIDLIALDGGVLVFVEVKGRPSAEEALFSITPRMKSRITAAAGHFIAAHPEHAARPMRFDVIAISLPFSLRHLDNAWSCDS